MLKILVLEGEAVDDVGVGDVFGEELFEVGEYLFGGELVAVFWCHEFLFDCCDVGLVFDEFEPKLSAQMLSYS